MEESNGQNAEERVSTEQAEQARALESAGWNQIEQTSAFQELIQKKKAFLIPAVIFFLVFYMALPVLGGFTTVLDGEAIGAITWAYVYGFVQFVMTWILTHLYLNRANKWDRLVDEARQEASGERTTR
jgi:uncharacterized membrane protein (DUF485 family)